MENEFECPAGKGPGVQDGAIAKEVLFLAEVITISVS